jgi:hypothetical protein
MTNEANQDRPEHVVYFHLKRDASEPNTRKPAKGSGIVYLTLCGRWVYDSIASDVDCPDRWVTCPKCAELDPHPEFRGSPAPTFGSR